MKKIVLYNPEFKRGVQSEECNDGTYDEINITLPEQLKDLGVIILVDPPWKMKA